MESLLPLRLEDFLAAEMGLTLHDIGVGAATLRDIVVGAATNLVTVMAFQATVARLFGAILETVIVEKKSGKVMVVVEFTLVGRACCLATNVSLPSTGVTTARANCSPACASSTVRFEISGALV